MNKVLAWGVIVGAMGLAYWWQPEFFQHSYAIIEHGDIPALAEYLRSFGIWGIVVTLILFVIMTFTIVFPFMILSGAAGIVYGLFWGIIISWMGEFIGAIVAFIFVRYFMRSTVARWIANSKYLKQVDDYSATNGFSALLIARLLPLAPSGIITAVAAISRISVRDFLLATFIGKLPPVVVKVLLGHDLAYLGQHTSRLILLCVLVVAVYGWLWWKKRKNR
ncbi:MAG: associated protein [Firmicutes bacterium]|nr:associated protein [Bacillota bacterium]